MDHVLVLIYAAARWVLSIFAREPDLGIAFVFLLGAALVLLDRVQKAQGRVRELEAEAHVLQDRVHVLQDRVRKLEADALAVQRADWLQGLSTIQCHNEVEVEIKIVYPMVRFLGYPNGAVRIRHPVRVQFGQQKLQGVADWVLFQGTKPWVVIEAKAPHQTLDVEARGQARSYAFALGAPFYMLTNGRQLGLYRLDMGGDRCLLECDLGGLAPHWGELEKWVGCPITPAKASE